MSEPKIRHSQEQESINIDDLRLEIEEQYQELCHKAQSGGSATLDELADVAGNMSKMMQVINELAALVIRLRDEKADAQ